MIYIIEICKQMNNIQAGFYLLKRDRKKQVEIPAFARINTCMKRKAGRRVRFFL